MSFVKNSLFFLILILLPITVAFAGNPVAPIEPGDNIQDPGDPLTAWGGCGPADSNCYVTVSSGDNIYTADGVLTGDRLVALGNNVLNIKNNTREYLTLDPTAGSERSFLQAYNNFGDQGYASLELLTTNADSTSIFKAQNADSASITAFANTGLVSTLDYSADTHTFYGNLGIGATPSIDHIFSVDYGGYSHFVVDQDSNLIFTGGNNWDNAEGLGIDFANHIYTLGDFTEKNNGTSMEITDSTKIISMRSNGIYGFYIEPTGTSITAMIGDTDGDGNSTRIQVNDDAQTINMRATNGVNITGERQVNASASGLLSSTATVTTTGPGDVANNLFVSTTNSNTISENTINGIFNTITDATNLENSITGLYTEIVLSGSVEDKSATGTLSEITSISTGQENLTGFDSSVSASGVITTGQQNLYGYYASVQSSGVDGGLTNVYGLRLEAGGAVTSGTINSYGVYIGDDGNSDTTGTSTKYGLYIEAQVGADNNYSAVFEGGNVGIGTITPTVPLDVLGKANFNSVDQTDAFVINNDGIDVFRVNNLGAFILLGEGGGYNVGISDATPDYLLDIESLPYDTDIFALTDSDGACLHNPEAGSEVVTCSSDERLKTNIVDTDSAISYFNDFRIRDYNVIASGDRMTGVIAQEVLETHPELVTMGPNGMYSVQLPNQWKLVKAIQELDLKVEGMGDFESEEDDSFVGSLRAWLGNVTNGIGDFFADRIRAKEEVCIGETCINEEELKTLIESNNLNTEQQDVVDDSNEGEPPLTEEDDTTKEDEPSVVVEENSTPDVEEDTETPVEEAPLPEVIDEGL